MSATVADVLGNCVRTVKLPINIFNLPYQDNKLLLYIVCTIAVSVDRTLRNTFTGTFYLIQILSVTSLIAS